MEARWPRGRILRHPLYRPGHVRLTLCTAEGLKQETIGKARKELYRAARKAMWGDSTPEWNEKPSTE
jgi:ribosomal protein RSM22 (predicted rRNA methylase)